MGKYLDLVGYSTNMYPLDLNKKPYSTLKRFKVKIRSYDTCSFRVRDTKKFIYEYHMCGDSINSNQLANSVRHTQHICVFTRFN